MFFFLVHIILLFDQSDGSRKQYEIDIATTTISIVKKEIRTMLTENPHLATELAKVFEVVDIKDIDILESHFKLMAVAAHKQKVKLESEAFRETLLEIR